MAGPTFQWDAPFEGKLWVAQLRVSNTPYGEHQRSLFRMAVAGPFTPEHHFGTSIWEDQPNFPTSRPIDVFSTMISVASLFQAHVNMGQLRYHR